MSLIYLSTNILIILRTFPKSSFFIQPECNNDRENTRV